MKTKNDIMLFARIKQRIQDFRRKYRWIWRIAKILSIVVGIVGTILAVPRLFISATDLYYKLFTVYEIKIDKARLAFDVLEQLDKELNEAIESTHLLAPVEIVNRGVRPVRLDRSEATLEVLMFKYFVGPREVTNWFRYRLVFEDDEITFKSKKESEELIRRPAVNQDFEGFLVLGGREGNRPRLLVSPGEKANLEHLQKIQWSFLPKFYEERKKQEKSLEERMDKVFKEGKERGLAFSGFFQSPWVEAREKLKKEMVVFCPGRRVEMVRDTFSKRAFLGRPEKLYVEGEKEDKGFMRIILQVHVKDSLGHKENVNLDFLTDCEFNEGFYQHVKDYPIKSLGYAKPYENIRQ